MYIAIYIDPYVILQYSAGGKKEKLHRERDSSRQFSLQVLGYPELRSNLTTVGGGAAFWAAPRSSANQMSDLQQCLIACFLWNCAFEKMCAVLRCAALCDMGCFVVEDDTRCSTGRLDFLVFLKLGYQQLIQISMEFSAKDRPWDAMIRSPDFRQIHQTDGLNTTLKIHQENLRFMNILQPLAEGS